MQNNNGPRSKNISEAILKHITIDNKSFSTIEGKGFLILIKEISILYEVPNREIIKS